MRCPILVSWWIKLTGLTLRENNFDLKFAIPVWFLCLAFTSIAITADITFTWSIFPRSKPSDMAFMVKISTSFIGIPVFFAISSKVMCLLWAGLANVICQVKKKKTWKSPSPKQGVPNFIWPGTPRLSNPRPPRLFQVARDVISS